MLEELVEQESDPSSWVISHWRLAHCELETLRTRLARLMDPTTAARRFAATAPLSGQSRPPKATISGNAGAPMAPATAWSAGKGGTCCLKSAPMGVPPARKQVE